ncbi:MAG: FtsH protease activity modulator HflK [Deltaproteobacteria bacterium]|nr:FtsH protease activity modulator HflK [Deltaproteobacteria bacterium]
MERFKNGQTRDPVKEMQRNLEEFGNRLNKFIRGWGSLTIIAIALGLYIISGFYVVGPGEKAVELLFGKQYSITGPGLHYRLPRPLMAQIVVDVSKVRRAEIGYRSDGSRTRSVPAESMMLTGDENLVDVQLSIQYIVNDPVKFLFGTENPENTLRTSAEVALRGAVSENTLDYTMAKGRADVQKSVEIRLQKLLNSYETGLQVTQARLLAVDPPSEVKEAFQDVVRASEDRERLIKEADGYSENLVLKARGEAQESIRQAEAYKVQRVIKAQGDAKRFSLLLDEYVKAPDVTRERLYFESVDKFLVPARKLVVEAPGSKIIQMLNLPDLTKTLEAPSVAGPDSAKLHERKGQ